jgi:hypothetical protein
LIESNRGELLERLSSFTAAACGDPVFRRELRYKPQHALARFGFFWEHGLPDQLPIRHYEVSVNFHEALLFGQERDERREDRPLLNEVERLLLLAGAKPLLLQHALEDHISDLAAELRGEGMTVLLSPYEFLPITETAKAAYSNVAAEMRPAVLGSGHWRTLIAGHEPDRVQIAWLCLLFGWDEFLGRLLGYPNCCATAFARDWPEARRAHRGEVLDVILARSPGPWVGSFGWETNIFARYQRIEIIQHFPCGWNCLETVRLARRNMGVLDAFGFDSTETLRVLRAPVLYTAQDGVVLFPGTHIEEDKGVVSLSFKSRNLIATNPDGELMRRLIASKGHLAVRANEILIADHGIDGWLIDFSGRLPS